tara:strand:- start:15917 stop:16654 length:738 start_codon:yes stop_codon:yes gene_type:complete
MFNKPFLELTHFAYTKSQKKFSNSDSIESNPYFIGFGNPDSDILFVGQEMAIDPLKNSVTLEMESYRNPEHWNTIIERKISEINYSFSSKNAFLNPRKPYNIKATGTWQSYEKIVEKIKNLNLNQNLEFFQHCFVTELNTKTSKRQIGFKTCDERELIIKDKFYKGFPITILATGSYIENKATIEMLFDVKHSKDDSDSQKYKRFEVYYSQNKKRVLINTRQLSRFYFRREEKDLYFQKIVNQVK